MSYCNGCNAQYSNDIKRVIRCGICVVQQGKPPTQYVPKEPATKEE